MSPTAARQPVGRRRRIGRALAEMHYQLRTEGDTPVRQAVAIWLGTVIGCQPLYGLHLPMSVVAARLLGISRIKTYLAAHVNNPLTAPLLLVVGAGLGHWIFTGRWPRPRIDELRSIGVLELSRDLLVGSLVIGVVLGTLFGLISLVISLRWKTSRFITQLRDAVSKRYVETGITNWEFVRGKLKHDPVYYELMRSGVLPRSGLLLDLGCGRGIVPALVRTSAELSAADEWADDWPPPPSELELVGVDSRARHVKTARTAMGDDARFEVADLRHFEPPRADAVILFDVLHYLGPRDQDRLLQRIAAALEPGGSLLVREADADGGMRFLMTRAAERFCSICRGEWSRRFHYRGRTEWEALLTEHGFEFDTRPMGDGTPYSNVLIRALKRPS